MRQKRCLIMQDYSCLGRCSMTVALPILSACGIEAVGIPTCVLSNHTAFPSWTFKDLTDTMKPSVEKWKGYNRDFDCIYTGYMTDEQIDIAIDIIDELKRSETMVVVDPAFADNYSMYKGFEHSHIEKLKELVKRADIVTPNYTEACLLTDSDYSLLGIDKAKDLSNKLFDLNVQASIITSFRNEDDKKDILTSTLAIKDKTAIHKIDHEKIEGSYHGAGDVYTAIFVGAMLNDLAIEDAFLLATVLTCKSVAITYDDQIDGLLYGLEFEKIIYPLTHLIDLYSSDRDAFYNILLEDNDIED